MARDPLPDDVLDLILDYFDNGFTQDRQSLTACSYVNRAFHALSQRRLFRDVRLEYDIIFDMDLNCTSLVDNDKTTGKKFLRLLERSPHIQTYVRKLTLEGRATKAWPFENMSSMPQFSFYSIVRRLDDFHTLTVQGSLQWHLLDQRLQSHLLNIMPRMQCLRLAELDDMPISALQRCLGLQELGLSSIVWDLSGDVVQADNGKIKLQVLDIGNPSLQSDKGLEIFDSPRSPLDLSQLRTLRLTSLSYTVEGINRMLSVCEKTLETLEFSVNMAITDPSLAIAQDPPDLSRTKNLRSLKINACVRGLFDEATDPALRDPHASTDFAFIDAMIQTLPGFTSHPSPKLQIGLSITIHDLNTQIKCIPWSLLFRSMNEDHMSNSLKVINLIVWKVHGYIRPAGLSEILEACPELGALNRKGLLNYGGP